MNLIRGEEWRTKRAALHREVVRAAMEWYYNEGEQEEGPTQQALIEACMALDEAANSHNDHSVCRATKRPCCRRCPAGGEKR